MVSEFHFFKKKKKKMKNNKHSKFEKIMFTSISDLVYFHPFFLHAVTFSHVLYIDVVRSQTELKLKVKTEISLCMAIKPNAIAIYTVLPYCVILELHR